MSHEPPSIKLLGYQALNREAVTIDNQSINQVILNEQVRKGSAKFGLSLILREPFAKGSNLWPL